MDVHVVISQIGKIRIPVRNYSASISQLEILQVDPSTFISNQNDTVSLSLSSAEEATMSTITHSVKKERIQFDSSFIVYMIALVSFVGWFLFVVSSYVQWDKRRRSIAHLYSDTTTDNNA